MKVKGNRSLNYFWYLNILGSYVFVLLLLHCSCSLLSSSYLNIPTLSYRIFFFRPLVSKEKLKSSREWGTPSSAHFIID